MSGFKAFYDTLIENLDSYDGEYASFIDYGPDLYKLLCAVLDSNELTQDLRLTVSAAIAYYVVPMDVIPEQEYGPYGYIDDIFISVYSLKKVADELGYELLQYYWEFDTDVKEVMDDCYEKSVELLGDKVYPVLSYVGLSN